MPSSEVATIPATAIISLLLALALLPQMIAGEMEKEAEQREWKQNTCPSAKGETPLSANLTKGQDIKVCKSKMCFDRRGPSMECNRKV